MPIRQLSPELAGKIAAGEVVERPVSVVKELVENSIDAGATRVSIEITGGGIDQVQIADNGAGIPPGEVLLAFQRHATSKLDSPDLLDAIPTLGFRGEALPSIAAVSRMSLTTRVAGVDEGYLAEFSWGQLEKQGPQGCPPGTTVRVDDLFGNLPARRKFLKSAASESGRIHDLIVRYALAYPEISFTLKVGERTALTSPGDANGENTAVAVYGPSVASNLLKVSGEDPETGYEVQGFIGNPGLHRANRTYMTFFVNRRWIQSRMLTFALEEAYQGMLPERRYPLAALNLAVPYEDVDVNSHPAKREVRFRQDGKVYSALQRAVRAALVEHSPVRGFRTSPGGQKMSIDQGFGSPGFFRSPFDGASHYPAGGASGLKAGVPGSGDGVDGFGPAGAAMTPQQALPALRVVGQVRLTYIVAESPDGMYLVDQHAAHERVLFDGIVRQSAEREVQSQPLLAPVDVDLTPGQVATLIEHSSFLTGYGFDVEEFGGSGYLVRAVPSILVTQDPGKSLVDLLDMVALEGVIQDRKDTVAATLACHSAIRAGQSMTEAEMRALLEQLEVTDNPHTCPHGRPTVIHFSSYHMEREFGRR
ncbi:MAG: DNA mismatch repair endonuclease MutL [Chloroflexi bacterium]|nr:DNA mismatch repair endonuclease MutL [Chloroflexota bacterium]